MSIESTMFDMNRWHRMLYHGGRFVIKQETANKLQVRNQDFDFFFSVFDDMMLSKYQV
jgi:hypothetical protein